MPEGLAIGDFTPHLHTRFRVARHSESGPEEYDLELTEVTDHSNAHVEQFSLVFTGIASPWLPQGLYQLVHQNMGEFELFLVPNGPDAGGMRYEAVFSRLIGPQTALPRSETDHSH